MAAVEGLTAVERYLGSNEALSLTELSEQLDTAVALLDRVAVFQKEAQDVCPLVSRIREIAEEQIREWLPMDDDPSMKLICAKQDQLGTFLAILQPPCDSVELTVEEKPEEPEEGFNEDETCIL